jgi:hypothetical protein
MNSFAFDFSALDDLMASAQRAPVAQVNGPEAAAVLAAQTAPEARGEPEPEEVVQQAAPAPTTKPAELVAQDVERAAKAAARAAKKAAKVAPAALPAPADESPAGQYSTEQLLRVLVARGYIVKLEYCS